MSTAKDRAAKVWSKAAALTVIILAAAHFAGCGPIGAKTVARDRLDYVSAISESWKRQTLLNLLKTRYLDAPVFMDVASVINQYSLEQEIGLGAGSEIYNRGEPSFISPEVSVKGTYTDRPTITYNPLLGENFARSLLKPIPNSAILLLIEAGYPIDLVLRICIQSINGLDNRRSGTLAHRPGDPGFFELLIRLRRLQEMKAIVLRAKTVDGKETLSIRFRPPNGAVNADMKRAKQILGLDPDAREFRVVSGSFATNNREIAVLGRSMLQIFSAYASFIDVPESHVSQGRVVATEQDDTPKSDAFLPLIRVHSGTSRPEDVFVSVPYRDHWF